MLLKWCVLLCCFLGTLQAKEIAYFSPPSTWKVIHQSPSSAVKISFVGKAKKNCQPVINLATEEVDVSLKEYLAIVQKNCEADPNKEWRDLGKFSTAAGEGRLVEILDKSEGKALRHLQLILLKDTMIYVVTATSSQKEFSKLYKEFYASFKSFNIVSDLLDAVKERDAKEKLKILCAQILKEKKFQKNTWDLFAKTILNNYTEMGNYWKLLLLQDIKDKLTHTQD